MNHRIAALLGGAGLLLSGCASIVSGQNQSLSVETRASDGSAIAAAYCRLTNNKGTWFVTTPGSVTVNRSFENLAVSCEKDAYDPGVTTTNSSTKGMAFGNILLGGVIGAGVDMATGAAYDYPTLITVVMAKKGAASAAVPAAPAAAASAAAPAPAASAAAAVATTSPPNP